LEEFALAAGNGVPIQAGDACQLADATSALPIGKEAEEESAVALVDRRNEVIDGLVFAGDDSVRLLPAGRAVTAMEGSSFIRLGLGHRPYLPGTKQQRGKGIVTGVLKLFFHAA
jgi:hypothetical protein